MKNLKQKLNRYFPYFLFITLLALSPIILFKFQDSFGQSLLKFSVSSQNLLGVSSSKATELDKDLIANLKSKIDMTTAANKYLNENFKNETADIELPGMYCSKVDLQDGSKPFYNCITE